jgi:hypothetical protein
MPCGTVAAEQRRQHPCTARETLQQRHRVDCRDRLAAVRYLLAARASQFPEVWAQIAR